jgi:putative two-component system hydrogenase maturation factor HypX/HoxX
MRDAVKKSIKLPASQVINSEKVRELPIEPWESINFKTYREIVYRERNSIGYIHFNFYNGAMSTRQCRELLRTLRYAKRREIKAIVLMGQEDFFSNGMNLNTIEASPSPADESWENINAMDDLCEELLTTTDKLTVSALQGNAGAGGVFLALTCDLIFAREGVVLNPHYKNIGNLYGSEFWTYTLPKRLGEEEAKKLMENRMPISANRAKELGLIDDSFGKTPAQFRSLLERKLESFIKSPNFEAFIKEKVRRRIEDEKNKPLRRYREEELERMKLNFYGFDTSYHIARYYFVHRLPHFRTPPYLAVHRRLSRGNSK